MVSCLGICDSDVVFSIGDWGLTSVKNLISFSSFNFEIMSSENCEKSYVLIIFNKVASVKNKEIIFNRL